MTTVLHALTRSIRARRRVRGVLLVTIVLAAFLASAAPVWGQDPPSSFRINGITHTYQLWNNCGPANLTMGLSYFGWGFDQRVAASFLKPNPEDKNVSPGQMVQFVNQQQDLPNVRALWRYGGDVNLLKRLIVAGFPVLVESGYDVEDLGWMGHYETVVAYDDASQLIWVYDSYLGNGNDGMGQVHTYAEFDSWWRHFNRVFIVLFTIDREADLRAVLGNYADTMWSAERALQDALQEAAANSNDVWAWFNAGTSAVKLGRYADAAIYFDEAYRLNWPYRVTWYQFGPYEAYYEVGRYNDVLALLDATAERTLYVEETNYWRGMVYAAMGRIDEANAQFDEALSFNRNFEPAQTAKVQLQTGVYAAPAPAR